MLHLVTLVMISMMLVATASAGNALKGHPSPYLAMHGDDPVEWRQWGKQAIEEARESNRPLFVSSGYFSCHWCHVMHAESYSSQDVSKLLNAHFIPVKIDRELEPALDAYLIHFVERTRGSAGWPLNVFLTPEGYPLTGFVYAPEENMIEILSRLSERWDTDADKLKQLAKNAFEVLLAEAEKSSNEILDYAELEKRYVTFALNIANDLQGGFGEQNQFPMIPQLMALLAIQMENSSDELKHFLQLTLDQMASRGLRDHLAGGFFRYTIDPAWEIPHYEKMLYTQAQMIRLYLYASRLFDRDDYLAVATDTADFVLDTMRGRGNGFISSFSAVDINGNEGGSYLWNSDQLKQGLNTAELAFAALRWGLVADKHDQLPIERMSLESVAVNMNLDFEDAKQLEKQVKKQLLERRDRENPPPADTKQLSGWNGLLLTALSELAIETDSASYRTASRNLGNWLVRHWDGEKLHLSLHGPQSLGESTLADYAYVAEGLLSAYEMSENDTYKGIADKIIDSAWQRFFSSKGWRLSETNLIPGIEGERAMQDAPMPAPSAVLMGLTPVNLELDVARQLQAAAISQEAFWFPGHVMQSKREVKTP